ncbi:hypothetical protein [Variovorax sp. efr-133-TYG-130]|nr:hypothetical protein [Variovorax sp. efr-133-TYG-130]
MKMIRNKNEVVSVQALLILLIGLVLIGSHYCLVGKRAREIHRGAA